MTGPRLAPLPPGQAPELTDQFASFLKSLGFVPNSVLTMARKPALVRAFVAMQAVIWSPDSKVDRGLKRLIAFAASGAVGDAYSMAHTASGAIHFGIEPARREGRVGAGGWRQRRAQRRHRRDLRGAARSLE
jgi:Carboxymuconolactone decarboxylase family